MADAPKITAEALPVCEFDDCEQPEDTVAVAVVPLVSVGMVRPYAWVLSCAACVDEWEKASGDRSALYFTPDAFAAGVAAGRTQAAADAEKIRADERHRIACDLGRFHTAPAILAAVQQFVATEHLRVLRPEEQENT